MNNKLSQDDINSLLNSIRTQEMQRESKTILNDELKAIEIKYKDEINALKTKIQLLEKELQRIKNLDEYEKIPYWLRPDFKIEFTYKN